MSANGQNNAVNERTYQEVEYLKKNLGPILVAALAEICIRRPADPIEYLGHWLLRWRYNEELKRRDVQNALEVVRQRQWAQVESETAAAAPAAAPEPFTDGFIPSHPHGPPGFGGPLTEEMEAEVEGNELEPENVEEPADIQDFEDQEEMEALEEEEEEEMLSYAQLPPPPPEELAAPVVAEE